MHARHRKARFGVYISNFISETRVQIWTRSPRSARLCSCLPYLCSPLCTHVSYLILNAMQPTLTYGPSAHSFTSFSSEEGLAFCREITAESLPWSPHTYQLEGACKALDGLDVLAITPTGSGKTGFLLIYMLVAQAIAKDPTLCPAPLR